MPISALKASKFFSSRMLMLAFYTAIFFFFALSALGIHAKYWSDSEIWGVRQASACWSTDWQSYACAQKPLFNLLVGGILAITDQVSVAPLMEMARNLTTISWALTIVIAIFYGMSAPMVLCFLGSSLFFMDASVARSDILALPLEVFFIGYVLRFTNEKPKAAWPLVLSAIAAILMTPKSLVTFICLIPLFAPLFPKRLFSFRLMAPALAAVAALFLVNWYSIGEYFFRLFSGDSYGFTYADPARFFFLNRALRENPHFVIILVIWLSAFAVRFVRERKFRAFRPSRIELSGLLLILLILVYPDKLPFWLSCESFVLLFVISQNLKNRVWSWVGAPITVFAVANGIHWYSQFRVDSNKRQQDFVEIFEDQLRATPAAFVYDGIGITPDNRPSPWFLGPGQKEQNLANLERIARRKPDIILMAHKLQIFFTQIQTFMIDNYVEPQPGLFIRSANVRLRHPERPAVEIQNAVYQYFEEYRTATTRFAIFIFRDGEWRLFESRALSLRDLARLPAICERCEIPQNVRLSAFGSFFARKSDVVVYNDFRFESERPRPTLLATLIHLRP